MAPPLAGCLGELAVGRGSGRGRISKCGGLGLAPKDEKLEEVVPEEEGFCWEMEVLLLLDPDSVP